MNKMIRLLVMVFLVSSVGVASARKPTLFTIGDSTVKNGRGDGAGGLWGWGDPLVQYFDTTKITVENHALGGTSSRTFITMGLWDKVKQRLQPGDFLLLQFGHNDGSALNDSARARGTIKGIGQEAEEIDNILTGKHEVVHSYGWYLTKIIQEAKAKGVTPVVITPIPRNDWENGKIKRSVDGYPQWAKQVAEREKVNFIDLHELLANRLDEMGEANVTGTYFFKQDHTHPGAKGAVLAASLIAGAISQKPVLPLKDFLAAHPIINFPVKRRIFIIGDSTVANGADSIVGWGREFVNYIDTTRAVIINKARGGRSSRTFLTEGLWMEVYDQLKPGDFVLMQFGHNDGARPDAEKFRGSLKGVGEDTLEVNLPSGKKEMVHTFGWYMKKYCQEAKAKGAIPIVLSMIPRNQWKEDKVIRVDSSYGIWSKESASMTGAFFIDLNKLVADKYELLGSEKVRRFFPGDHTHTNKNGADFNARTIAEAILSVRNTGLQSYIKEISKK